VRLELGRPVRCTDDVVGELADLVIDPVKKRVTHLVVKPHDGLGEGHLVPIELAEAAAKGPDISLKCTSEDVRRLPHAEEFTYLRLEEALQSDPDGVVGFRYWLAMPSYEDAGFDGYVTGLV